MSFDTQDLNRKITFQQVTLTQDPNTGEMVEAWTDFVSVFARVDPMIGREFFASATTNAEANTKFTMRYRGDIVPAMRIAFGGETYNITSIQNIRTGNRETLIYAKAAV